MNLRNYWDQLVGLTSIRAVPSPLTPASDEKSFCLDVPGFRQVSSYSCGYIVGLMVARFFDSSVPEDEFYTAIDPTAEYGVPDEQLIEVLWRFGVKVRFRAGLSFEDLEKNIRASRPMITSVRRRTHGHWVVIYGIGREPDRVYVSGNEVPGLGRLFRSHEMPREEFEKIWDEERFCLICSKK